MAGSMPGSRGPVPLYWERAGKVLVVCRAGCSQSNIIQALREMCLWGNVSCLDIQLPPAPEPQNDMDRRIRKAEKMWG